jgi:hypothetical protein
MVMILENVKGFSVNQLVASGWTGLGAICAVDPRSGGERGRGPAPQTGPLVHGGPSQGG